MQLETLSTISTIFLTIVDNGAENGVSESQPHMTEITTNGAAPNEAAPNAPRPRADRAGPSKSGQETGTDAP